MGLSRVLGAPLSRVRRAPNEPSRTPLHAPHQLHSARGVLFSGGTDTSDNRYLV